MLSTTAVYAFRIMVVLAESTDRSMTSERIAASAGVPADYSVKVLQMLARGRFVRAQRGRGGGFRLACDPDETSLLDILRAIEQPRKSAPAPRELPDVPIVRVLQKELDKTVDDLHTRLRGITLKRMVDAASAVVDEAAAAADETTPATIEVMVDRESPETTPAK